MNAQNWRFDSQIMQHDFWCSNEKWQPTHMVNTWIAFLSAANDQADLVITRVAVLVLVLAAPCLDLFAPDFGAVISLVKVHEV